MSVGFLEVCDVDTITSLPQPQNERGEVIAMKDIERIIDEYKKAHRKECFHKYSDIALDVILLKCRLQQQNERGNVIAMKDVERIINEHKKAHRKDELHIYSDIALDVILLKCKNLATK